MKSLLLSLGAGLVAGLPSQHNAPRAPDELPTFGLANITKIDLADTSSLKGRALSGPFMGVDFPDPSIIWGDGSWKAYATSSNGKVIPVATSSDTLSWTLSSTDALPNPGSWVDPNDKGIWAPDVQKNDAGTYVMYYTAHQNGGSHCIGVATSTTAIGPFTPQSNPLICDTSGGGVIDASGYDDGTDRWILWKVDGNSLGGATTCQGGTPSGSYKSTPIKIQKMARDAITLQGSAKTILDNEGASNNGVVEAPALYKIGNGNYVLFYSAHCYSSDDYDVEYAFSSTIDGSYTNRGILIRTVDNKSVYGPGGLDIDPNGKNVVFHGRLAANQGNAKRELYSAQLTISGKSISGV
ncbi:glycoside hydrolase family 43 protein [Annulohypoxylon maeteangense]|uniref:glycoside hydrolase family 43 protein n=1 Tax=Annulohypoxylon maeteangense TaxID=1927788 RepID=UPI0020085A37|nr:glycoside hydrolase family 43 protein [Annulohypoxylon maeteangense]KAI0888738.1 glycoside hydrolase family 43 protein [Annulohypoxylon maeteangense]